MPNLQKFAAFVTGVATKQRDISTESYKLALVANANTPNLATNAVIGDLTEVAYTNVSSRTVTTTSASYSSGAYRVIGPDVTLTAGPAAAPGFRYVVLYDVTSGKLAGYWDYGADVVLNVGESLLVDLDQTNGFLVLT